ncbi:MAG: hypothetical protein JRE64_14390 [Deltaproteobacteria bacterium]|nr:hypothetical protein [Deltaproteobacteria bacterium]
MIFVTVGTTYFDDLIQEVDRLRRIGVIQDKVVAQIGSGSYEPKHLEWFRYSNSIQDYFKDAVLCICHGGVGSIFELLALKKDIIAVANRELKDDHQADLIRVLAKHNWCRYCLHVKELEDVLKDSRPRQPYSADMRLSKNIWRNAFGSET